MFPPGKTTFLFERHAPGVQALQPNPEPGGALQPAEANTETAFFADFPQTGHSASFSCVLRSFSKVVSHDSQWYSNNGMISLTAVIMINIFSLYNQRKRLLKLNTVTRSTKKGWLN
jgi:hypothetical protein